jgi:hypothetical protein
MTKDIKKLIQFQWYRFQKKIRRLKLTSCRKQLIIFGIAFSLVLTVIFIVVYVISAPKPPMFSIRQCRLAVIKARKADAPMYAPKLYKEAENAWNETLKIWDRENKKLTYKRDLAKVQKLANKTNNLAIKSMKRAVQAKDSLRSLANIELALLQEKVEAFHQKYDGMPMDKTCQVLFSKGELFFLEGRAALKRCDYKRAVQKLKNAEPFIGKVGNDVSKMLGSYLKNIPMWRQWAEENIEWSRSNNSVTILVDKLAHKCQIYDCGSLIHEYRVELGPNWIGHKRYKGDNATPEGQYFIRQKADHKQSKYYKALAINYPNQRDLEIFEAAQKRGELSFSAQIGGLIEIHGEGGKGINWTQGCVALKNSDLDVVYNLVQVGTPVTIVGSINGLSDRVHSNEKNLAKK